MSSTHPLDRLFESNTPIELPHEESSLNVSKMVVGETEYNNIKLGFHYDRHGDDFFTFRRTAVDLIDSFTATFNGPDEVQLFFEGVPEPVDCLVRSNKSKSDGEIEIVFSSKTSPMELIVTNECNQFECLILDGPDLSNRPQPVNFNVAGFRIYLSELPEAGEIRKKKVELKRETFPTTRMVIEVEDGQNLPISSIRRLLRDLLDFFALIRSRRSGIGHGRGYTADGNVSHYLLSFFASDQIFSKNNWFCHEALVDIQSLSEGFFKAIQDDSHCDVLRKAIDFYSSANFTEDRSREVALITGFAALEQLSTYILKTEAGWQSDLFGRSTKTASMIAASLSFIGLSVDPLEHLDCLRQRSKSYGAESAYDLIARFRNGLVHSNDTFRYDGRELLEAFQLVMWLVELHILYLIGYRGQISDRRKLTGWSGETTAFPLSR